MAKIAPYFLDSFCAKISLLVVKCY